MPRLIIETWNGESLSTALLDLVGKPQLQTEPEPGLAHSEVYDELAARYSRLVQAVKLAGYHLFIMLEGLTNEHMDLQINIDRVIDEILDAMPMERKEVLSEYRRWYQGYLMDNKAPSDPKPDAYLSKNNAPLELHLVDTTHASKSVPRPEPILEYKSRSRSKPAKDMEDTELREHYLRTHADRSRMPFGSTEYKTLTSRLTTARAEMNRRNLEIPTFNGHGSESTGPVKGTSL